MRHSSNYPKHAVRQRHSFNYYKHQGIVLILFQNFQVCNNSSNGDYDDDEVEENNVDVGGALGFRDDISTLCLDSQVGIILRSQVAAASGMENLTEPSAPMIVIHSYKYLSNQRPTPKQPTHV